MTIPFVERHVGPQSEDIASMVREIGVSSLDNLIDQVVPATIREASPLALRAFPEALSESEALALLRGYAAKNDLFRSYIGMGYYGTETPGVILRNIFENPGWYTQYTPYQPEISQGRLEALLNFQTLISNLTGLPIANASLLDEGTAAAEAMALSKAVARNEKATSYWVSHVCHPQTIAVVKTRAEALGLNVVVADLNAVQLDDTAFGVLVQYPDTWGGIDAHTGVVAEAKKIGALVTFACDLLSLTLLTAPGSLGADIAVGSAQRFGVPLGYGGPHAAFFATSEAYKRLIPGRLVGVSRDADGQPALRLSLQTREQHIRREKATSNICTAQVLLAIISSMYAVYHGPKGLRGIAKTIRSYATQFASICRQHNLQVLPAPIFDTVTVEVEGRARQELLARAAEKRINLRVDHATRVALSFDETVTNQDFADLTYVFTGKVITPGKVDQEAGLPSALERTDALLPYEVFHRYHTETELLRYIKRLESKDLSLAQSMIPLGSCTMKLNATTEMIPVTWPAFSQVHPFVPEAQMGGYASLFKDLEDSLADITGFAAVSLQPNAGSQGEYAGLLAIRAYLESKGQHHRTVCLIPKSAHGTNPASAVMVGLKVVVVACDDDGNVSVPDLKAKIAEHKESLAAVMITYPSTHGVFEETIREIADLVHGAGGQVYMDGANLNALVGLCKPGNFGMDVCHINLHKTFCIPHGGGGPGMGPIGVAKHLAPFLPSHPLHRNSGVGPVSAAPWGSASILPISWAYIAMMGGKGLTHATKVAILNANYIANRLKDYYPIVYTGANNRVAHECIIDLRPLKERAGVEVDDVAKRLMDYGIHAPTVSWPVAGTMMVEPTESESLFELNRFCDAMVAIAQEIRAIEEGTISRTSNPLKHAPHTARSIAATEWEREYPRELGAFPVAGQHQWKFWPAAARIDAAFGDRNLVCACPSVDSYTE
jgi:glycine dehydrogenase